MAYDIAFMLIAMPLATRKKKNTITPLPYCCHAAFPLMLMIRLPPDAAHAVAFFAAMLDDAALHDGFFARLCYMLLREKEFRAMRR